MFLAAAVGGSAMIGALSASPMALCEREESAARPRMSLPEPGSIYREHQEQRRIFRASVVPSNLVTFFSTEDDDVEAGVLLKNPADYESHSVARMYGKPVSPIELNSSGLTTGESICEVVKN
jgi:hypothetical protein